MINLLRRRLPEILRAFLVASVLFLIAYLADSLLWQAIWFALAAIFFVTVRLFSPPAVESGLSVLKEKVVSMAGGNLEILKMMNGSPNGMLQDVSTSLLLLNARLRQMITKVKGLSGSVRHTSDQIVDLSHVLLRSGQNQSSVAERVSSAIQEMNAAILDIAHGAESMNELGITASSATLELTASTEEVLRNARQVTEFARATQSSMELMVKRMSEIQGASQMLIQSSAEMDTSVRNMQERTGIVTLSAAEADDFASQAALSAKSGAEVVADVQSGMQKIVESFQNTSRVIESLAQRSEQIGEILDVIIQIADQTNLLSLNAAILSAQAGVHGKGFAVVADEIRKLSTRTASSVNQIEELISKVRLEITESVKSMEAGKKRLDEGLILSEKASQTLLGISTSAALVREKVAAIASSSREQLEAEMEVRRSTSAMKERFNNIAQTIHDQTKVNRELYLKAQRVIELLQNVERGIEEQTHGAREVSHIVERVSEIIQSSHSIISKQSIVSPQIVQSVTSLRTAVQSATATIRSLNATALSLDQESFILENELSTFRLPEPKPGGTLQIGVPAKVSSMDPADAQYVHVVDMLFNFYEGLVEFGEGTDIRSCLAERWDISEDGLVYTFKLKRGVRFHNGKEMTAEDVKCSFERILNPQTRSTGAWVFEMIEGAEDFMKGRSSSVVGIRIIDPYTLQIRITEPIPFFLAMLAQPSGYVLPLEYARKQAPLSTTCGTGPFKLDRFVKDELIEMSKFESYHLPSWPYVDRVIVQFGMQESEIAAAMKANTIHFTTELQKQQLDQFLNEPQWMPRFQTNVQLYTSFLALSCRIPPLNDVRVRQAIAFAIDRERILKEVVGTEKGLIARSLLPPGLPAHDSAAIGYMYDPNRATKLLREAKVSEGTPLEVWHAESASNPAVLQIIQEDLKAVGLNLHIRYITTEVFQDALSKGLIPMRMTRWVADYPDPDNFLYVTFHTRSSVFNLGFSHPEFDRLTERARSMADVSERIQLYQRAERILMQECPCVMLFHMRALVLHQEYVQGCIPHFTQPIVRLKKVWLSN